MAKGHSNRICEICGSMVRPEDMVENSVCFSCSFSGLVAGDKIFIDGDPVGYSFDGKEFKDDDHA